MSRDMISLRDFNALTRIGLLQFAEDYNLGDIEYMPVESWASLFFILRQAEDSEGHFPCGKWAAIQQLEKMLNEYGNDRLKERKEP